MYRRFAPHATVALVLLLLALAMTWPLLPNLTRAASDPGDPYINAFILDWGAAQTLRAPLALFDAPLFFPARRTLAFSEHLYGLALLSIPLRAAGLSPLTAHIVLLLLGFVASGLGAYVLVLSRTRSIGAAAVAAILFAFVPYRLGQISHLQHVWSPFLPLALQAILRLADVPTVHKGAMCALILLCLGLTNIHWLLFGGTMMAVTSLILVCAGVAGRRFVLLATAASAVAALCLLPFLLPYRRVAEDYGLARSYTETLQYSAQASDWLRAPSNNRIHGPHAGNVDGERRLFPGVILPALVLVGAVSLFRRHARDAAVPFIVVAAIIATGIAATAWQNELLTITTLLLIGGGAYACRGDRQLLLGYILLVWIGLGFVGSLGLNGFFHRTRFTWFEPFRALRVPARWAIVTCTGAAALAAYAFVAMERLWPRAARYAAVAVLAGFLFEARTAPYRWYLQATDDAAVYDWLARLPDRGGTLELPISTHTFEYDYTLAATRHHRRIVNGASGVQPPFHRQVTSLAHANPIPARLSTSSNVRT
jgi:hypothetical protein